MNKFPYLGVSHPSSQSAMRISRTPGMKRILRHVMIPTLLPAAFFVVVMIPVEVMGCRGRGLAAILIALAGALLGLASALKGIAEKMKGNPDTNWWILSTLILAIPAVYIVMIAR